MNRLIRFTLMVFLALTALTAPPPGSGTSETLEEKPAGDFYLKGTWIYEQTGFSVEVTFLDGFRYTRTTTDEQSVENAMGTYSVGQGILELREDGREIIRFPYREKDMNTFEVQDEGIWFPVRRQDRPGPLPKSPAPLPAD